MLGDRTFERGGLEVAGERSDDFDQMAFIIGSDFLPNVSNPLLSRLSSAVRRLPRPPSAAWTKALIPAFPTRMVSQGQWNSGDGP